MRIVVLEDEPPARERLVAALARIDPAARVEAALAGVDEAATWFAGAPAPDLVLADIQLADGLSFEVFERIELACPIVFCTAYDQYVLEAMAAGGIDYLVKPIRDDELARALARYRRLEHHFDRDRRLRLEATARMLGAGRRRVLVRDGEAMISVTIDRVAYFAVRDGVTEVVTDDGRRLDLDRPLAELEGELEPGRFFRLNRQVLAQAEAIAALHPWTKGRLRVELRPPHLEPVIVAQPSAGRLRTWLGG